MAMMGVCAVLAGQGGGGSLPPLLADGVTVL